jgi:hypothetical protein
MTSIVGLVDEAAALQVLEGFRSATGPGVKAWFLDTRETTDGIATGTRVIVEARKLTAMPIVVLATSPVLKMAAATVSLASGGRLKRFEDLESAEAFLASVPPASST